jgi:hypothetical protein
LGFLWASRLASLDIPDRREGGEVKKAATPATMLSINNLTRYICRYICRYKAATTRYAPVAQWPCPSTLDEPELAWWGERTREPSPARLAPARFRRAPAPWWFNLPTHSPAYRLTHPRHIYLSRGVQPLQALQCCPTTTYGECQPLHRRYSLLQSLQTRRRPIGRARHSVRAVRVHAEPPQPVSRPPPGRAPASA